MSDSDEYLPSANSMDPFPSKKITDISIINECFDRIDFHTALGFIATVATLSFLRPGGIDGSWYGFSETQVRRIHGPFELVFIPVSARGFTLFTQKDIGQLRKGLVLHYK